MEINTVITSFLVSSTALTIGVTGAYVVRSKSLPMRTFMSSFAFALTAILIAIAEEPVREYENAPALWVYSLGMVIAAVSLYFRLKEIAQGRREKNRRVTDE